MLYQIDVYLPFAATQIINEMFGNVQILTKMLTQLLYEMLDLNTARTPNLYNI